MLASRFEIIASFLLIVYTSRKAKEAPSTIEATDPLAIWKEDEIPNEEDLIDKFDKRPTPKYEFFFKALVGSEDVFLGMFHSAPHLSHIWMFSSHPLPTINFLTYYTALAG